MPPPNDNVPEREEFDDDDFEPLGSFGDDLHKAIASPIKQFLINYLGEALNNADPETFLAIEEVIKEDIRDQAESIPDLLYLHRTILDSDEWDKAFDNFKPPKDAVYPWPELESWYNRPDGELEEDGYEDEEDEEDPEEMPEEAKKIIDHVDDMLARHLDFKTFLRECTPVIIRETRLYLEKNASFDLAILSEEGFLAVETAITQMAEILAENLHAQVADL